MVDIRPMRDADIEGVVGVHMGGWLSAYKGIIADEVLANLDKDAWLKRYRDAAASDGPWRTLIAVADRPLGHVTYGPYREQGSEELDPAVGEILSIYVDESVYGTGVGARLMAEALLALPQPEVRLWVLEENQRARRFYEKCGLRPDGDREIWTPRGTTLVYPEIRYSILR